MPSTVQMGFHSIWHVVGQIRPAVLPTSLLPPLKYVADCRLQLRGMVQITCMKIVQLTSYKDSTDSILQGNGVSAGSSAQLCSILILRFTGQDMLRPPSH